MTYFEPNHTYTDAKGSQSWLDWPAVQCLIAGVYFMLGLARGGVMPSCEVEGEGIPDYSLSRSVRRIEARKQRRATPAARSLSALRPLMDGGRELSRTQFLERCTRLSCMGRFQIYGFLYYRREFWRRGAIRARARAPMMTVTVLLSQTSCGLSASHLWPD